MLDAFRENYNTIQPTIFGGYRRTMSDLSPPLLDEMSDVELLCQAIHICGADQLTQDNSFLKTITFQKLAQVIFAYKILL